MTLKTAPIGEDDLTAYVDNELSAERRALVETWLVDHPAKRQRLEADLAIQDDITAALGPLVDESLPERFRVEAIADGVAFRRLVKLRRIAAIGALIAFGTTGGWILRGQSNLATDSRMAGGEQHLALAAYRLYVPEKLHPVEVSAIARDHLGVWLGKRIGARLIVPDLTGAGLTLIGGRLLPGENGAAGMLMYEDQTGARATLFLEAGKGDENAFAFRTDGDTNMLAWRDPDMAYVLTGPFDRTTLMNAAHFVHAAQK